MANTTTAAKLVADEVLSHLGRQRQTRAWLAEQTGIPLSTLNRRLNAFSAFTIDELSAVAGVLGIDIKDLVAPLFGGIAA